MQKRTITLIVILCVLLIVGLAGKTLLTVTTANLEKLRTITVESLDLTLLEDGTYTGSYARFPLDVEVAVEVRNTQIAHIELVKHRNGQGEQAEIIPSLVVKSQSLDVDTVSGATYSSIVILKAIEDALSAK